MVVNISERRGRDVGREQTAHRGSALTSITPGNLLRLTRVSGFNNNLKLGIILSTLSIIASFLAPYHNAMSDSAIHAVAGGVGGCLAMVRLHN